MCVSSVGILLISEYSSPCRYYLPISHLTQTMQSDIEFRSCRICGGVVTVVKVIVINVASRLDGRWTTRCRAGLLSKTNTVNIDTKIPLLSDISLLVF